MMIGVYVRSSHFSDYFCYFFNVSLTCSPHADQKIFDNSTAVVYVVAYNGREGQLGYVHDNILGNI